MHRWCQGAHAPLSSRSAKFFLGKISIGAMNTPVALMQQTAVMVKPFSALVAFPTCFKPFGDKIDSLCFWTVLSPVSSILKILPGSIPSESTLPKFSKNRLTSERLKPIILDMLVDSGICKLRSGCLFRNPRNQSPPADLFSLLKGWLSLFFVASS